MEAPHVCTARPHQRRADAAARDLHTPRHGAPLREQTGLDLEDGEREYVKTQKFYLNLPNPESADRTTVQLFRESDGHVEHEITFWTPDAVDDLTEMQFHSL